MEEKRDPKAEAMIDTLTEFRGDMSRADISTIFYLGAMYANSRAQEKIEKIKNLFTAFGDNRAKRAADAGRRP